MSVSSGSWFGLPLSTVWVRRKSLKTQRRQDAEVNQNRNPGAAKEPAERSTLNVQRPTLKYAPKGGFFGVALDMRVSRGAGPAMPARQDFDIAGPERQLPNNRAPQSGVSMLKVGRWRLAVVVFLGLVIGASGCSSGRPQTVPTEPTKPRSEGWTEKGDASWYGEPYHGRRTASGEVYDMHQMTAAHRSLPFDTMVRVTRRDNGAEVEVRVNDRGPFIKGRIIDLSFAAAKVIGLDIDGVAPVKLKVLGRSRAVRSDTTESPIPGSDRDDCLWVQVGAFSSSDNAARAVDRLEHAGEKALAMEGPDGLERVRVGPFETQEEAQRARKRLVGDWPAARIVECGG